MRAKLKDEPWKTETTGALLIGIGPLPKLETTKPSTSSIKRMLC
jgi:hypothetical protein